MQPLGRGLVALFSTESVWKRFLRVLMEELHIFPVKSTRKVVSQLHHCSLRIQRLTCIFGLRQAVVLLGRYLRHRCSLRFQVVELGS